MLEPISCTNVCFNNFHGIGSGVGRYSVKPVASNTNRQNHEKFGRRLWIDEAKRISERLKPQQLTTDVYIQKNIHESKSGILKPNELLDGVAPARTNVQEKTECTLKLASATNRLSQVEPVHGSWVDEAKRVSEKSKQQNLTAEICIRKNNIVGSNPGILKPNEILTGVIQTSTNLHVHTSETNKLKCCDVQKNKVPVVVFDVETTGFSRDNDSIIEIGFRDLNGGKNNCFETLVNPGRYVPNWAIHGITTQMVNCSNVPRFKELIPILRGYVELRKIPNEPILLVAHNARRFDVPFLINEFRRCSEEIPSDWLFLDTLQLARELEKLDGPKKLNGKSLGDLRDYYEIPLVGKAHRAMSDVHSLSMILEKMTRDLQISVSGLLDRSFKASDIGNTKKKK